MNSYTVEVLARQRYTELAADALGDQLLARAASAARDADDGTGSGAASDEARGSHLVTARRRFRAAVGRLRSPAREASGGRFSI